MSDFTGTFGANQGIQVTLNARLDATRRCRFCCANQPSLPAAPGGDVSDRADARSPTASTSFDSNLQMPYTQSYTVGWQRKLGRDTAFELRYVGSRHRQDWDTVNLNEININDQRLRRRVPEGAGQPAGEHGRRPRRHVRVHRRAGHVAAADLPRRSSTGRPGTQAGDAARYAGANWTNATFLGFLAAHEPEPVRVHVQQRRRLHDGESGQRLPREHDVPEQRGGCRAAGQLLRRQPRHARRRVPDDERRRHARQLGAGRVPQAAVERAAVQHQLHLEQRLRAAAIRLQQATRGDRPGRPGRQRRSTPSRRNWIYELPFGRDRRFGSNAGGFLDALIGGWSIDGVARIQTGETLDFGNVRLVGMTVDEFRNAIKLRVGANGQMFILPDDILENTVRAFAVSATSATGYGALGAPTGRYLAPANGPDCIETAPGYGDCGLRSLIVNGPRLVRFDLGAGKKFRIKGNVSFEFRGEMLNAFNTPYFNPGAERAAIDRRPAARHDEHLRHDRHRGSGRDSRLAAQQPDRRLQRRQLPPDAAARRQPERASFS